MLVKGSDPERDALGKRGGGIYLIQIRYSKIRNARNGKKVVFTDLYSLRYKFMITVFVQYKRSLLNKIF